MAGKAQHRPTRVPTGRAFAVWGFKSPWVGSPHSTCGAFSYPLNPFPFPNTTFAVTTQSRSLRLADSLSRAPFAWPGGYPLHAITNDGATLCRHCCSTERSSIGTTTGHDGWTVIALNVNWEDPDLFCDHCSERIESAYAEA